MKFTKMHGIGNDYIYVSCFTEQVGDPSRMARLLSDRHFGIGSDGLILICPSEVADFQMVMYNSDGSRAEMCGNGIRCVGKYVYDRGLTDKTTITVETLGGIKTLTMTEEQGQIVSVTVDMGKPILAPGEIPVLGEGASFIGVPIEVCGREVPVTAVSMGNPHAVVFVPEVDSLNLREIGPAFEHHALFPERTNTEFVQVIDREHLKMRVWERGAGETLACGTGACACLVAAVCNGKSGRAATLHLLGGDLQIVWDEKTDHVFMTGPAATVFDGEIDTERLGVSYGENQ